MTLFLALIALLALAGIAHLAGRNNDTW